MKLQIGFGASTQDIDVPDTNLIGIMKPEKVETLVTGVKAVINSLTQPIESPRLSEIIKPGEKIVIITSDITRPLPSNKIIPAVLDELCIANVHPEDVTIVFALGGHRKHTKEEMVKLVGKDIYNRILCVDSDPDDFVYMGTTGTGTPVNITRIVAEAEMRIGIGNIEYHYFAGYSGGAKAIMPGVSTRSAIQSNHSKMVQPESTAGRIEGNPVRQDIEEAIKYCPLDFIVNVVLDEHKEIIYAVAGHPIYAHRDGCRFIDKIYRKNLSRYADIVIASQGGEPKDLNLYQTQKALDNAKHAVRPGGIIILVGSCREGMGDEVFENWMVNSDSVESLIQRIQADFQLGGHKAAAIALVLQRADIYLVSEMEQEFVRSIFLNPYATVQSALRDAFAKLGNNATVLVMPYAGLTLPFLIDK